MGVRSGDHLAERIVLPQSLRSGREHVEKLSVLVENLNPAMPAIDHEDPAVVAHRDAVDGIELVGPWIFRIGGGRAPVLDELSVLVELRDPHSTVAVADEERAVGEPRDVGRAIEELALVASSLPLRPERESDLAVVSELVNHVQLVVDHPDVLFRIVGAHLDLVRPAPAAHLEELVVLGPVLYLVAHAVHYEENVVI